MSTSPASAGTLRVLTSRASGPRAVFARLAGGSRRASPRVVRDARTSSRRVVRAAADAGADRPTASARLAAGLPSAPPSTSYTVDAPPPSGRAARVRARRRASDDRLVGPHGGSRVTPRDASLAVAAETVALAGGVDVLIARALHLARDDQTLEVALHLATDAALVAARDAREAAAALEACVVAHADHPGRDREDVVEDALRLDDALDRAALDDPLALESCEATEAETLEAAFQRASLTHAAAMDARDVAASALSGRLVEDRWAAAVAAVAATDWRRDKKKPRVRAKDRGCHQPKARQGWNKRAMRVARVRLCAGCERALPSDELIRVARLSAEEGADEEGAEEEGAEEGADEGAEPSSEGTNPSARKKKTRYRRGSRNGWAVVVDASSLGVGGARLATLVAPGGACDALTRAHPAAAAAAAALAADAAREREEHLDHEPRAGSNLVDDASESKREESSRRRSSKTPTRLQGRAAYVCRRGFCARRAMKTKGLGRGLKAFPGGDDPRAFADALARLCDAAEAMDGVDSSRWVLARERGTPSRWEAHPTVLDGDEGIEVASERAKKDAVWREEKRKDEEDDGGG